MEKFKNIPVFVLILLLIIAAGWITIAVTEPGSKPSHTDIAENYSTGRNPVSSNHLKSGQHPAAAVNHLPETGRQIEQKTTSSSKNTGHLEAAAKNSSAPAEHLPQKATMPFLKSAPEIKGVAFVNSAIKPLAYELDERFWGWRPNDIINITDNVNNFQLGVLEVTRRTSVILAERISRTGSSSAFNRHLEHAMNWFMIKADKYWFPSPESKYHAGLKELAAYRDELKNHQAFFYNRADNLLPLLMAYEDLLGSCDENLIKATEDDGTQVSFFKADNYFFYSKGVAGAMVTMLEAIEKDFHVIIASRSGLEVLHHAHEMCKTASDMSPWIILNGDMDGILANHRANIAAPISHARFYLGVLIKILST